MSTHNLQSDTSRPIVKNPLLSGVAGSIDDFVNNTILLPAAEIPTPVELPSFTEPQDIDRLQRDISKSVIYGNEPAIAESDKFSEISLDQSDVDQQFPPPFHTQTNPLQNLDPFSPNDLNEPTQRDETAFNPLAPATAIRESLSQLPGVASSVFSSFSSILKGSVQQERVEDSSNAQLQYTGAVEPNQYQCFYDQSLIQPEPQPKTEIEPIAPAFYSPTDPNLIKPEANPLSPLHDSNLYRLKERKKHYAQIPGLNANNLNVSGSVLPNSPAPPTQQNPVPLIEQTQSKPNNSFSLSSFFGTPLLDKIQSTVLPKSDESSNTIPVDHSLPSPAFIDPSSHFQPEYQPSIPFIQSEGQIASNIVQPLQPSAPLAPPTLFNLNPYQQPPPPLHSTSEVSPLTTQLRQTHLSNQPVPTLTPSPAPITINSAPPIIAAESSSYRLRGKPLYKKPAQQSDYNTTPYNLNQAYSSTASLTGPPVAPPSIPSNIQIFNPSSFAAQSSSIEQLHSQSTPSPSQFGYTTQQAQLEQYYSTIDSSQPTLIEQEPPKSGPTPIQLFSPATVPGFALESQFFAPALESSVVSPTEQQPQQQQQVYFEQFQPKIEEPQGQPFVGIFPPSALSPIQVFNPAASPDQTALSTAFFPPTTSPPAPLVEQSPKQVYFDQFQPTPESGSELFGEVAPQSASPQIQLFSPGLSHLEESTSASLTPIQLFNPLAEQTHFEQIQSLAEENPPTAATATVADSYFPSSVPQLQSFFDQDIEPSIDAPFAYTQPAEVEQPLDTFQSSGVYTESIYSQSSLFSSTLAQTSGNSVNLEPEHSATNDFITDKELSNQFNSSDARDTISDIQTFVDATANNGQQNLFNDLPPLTEVQKDEQDKNFDFIRTNLLNKRIESIAGVNRADNENTESLSIASVTVEPASSAQSEISEYATDSIVVLLNRIGSIAESLQAPHTDQADGLNSGCDSVENQANLTEMSIERTSSPYSNASTNIVYRPVYHIWFYKTSKEAKQIWTPFSFTDSMLLEEMWLSKEKDVVTTDGGRFDVNIPERCRTAVYWLAEKSEVRRCSWFYKGPDCRLIPYEEDVAQQLEDVYRDASNTGKWQREITLSTGEVVAFKGHNNMVHYLKTQSTETNWNAGVANGEQRPLTVSVKRGTDDFAIEDGEPEQIDHLLFMVHGIGSACDLKFRKVEEVVDEFRAIALQLIQSHYRNAYDQGHVGRVEVLPISWHSELHSDETGIDEKLKSITLDSIPKLRNFTNNTLLDILFYTSPVFCQQIIDAVAGNLNKSFATFCERNPNFNGSVSVSGHSLGSLILFDLLQHQHDEMENSENLDSNSSRAKSPLKRHCSQQINYTIGHAGTGQPYITYPQLNFQPKHFFALGSPIGMFVTIRGIDSLGLDFKLPTTNHFFNIFHPYDPVAYRIEALVNSELTSLRPVLVPHHKGRKRMHLELRETVARVGADIKQKIMQTLKSTIDTVYSYTTLTKNVNDTKAITMEVDKVINEQLTLNDIVSSTNTSSASSEVDTGETDLALGKINAGRRIDYVLQEAPLEIINEYLFALTSHVCYWGSEDATLFIIKEIYSSLGIQADTKVPQPTMTIERPSPSTSAKSNTGSS